MPTGSRRSRGVGNRCCVAPVDTGVEHASGMPRARPIDWSQTACRDADFVAVGDQTATNRARQERGSSGLTGGATGGAVGGAVGGATGSLGGAVGSPVTGFSSGGVAPLTWSVGSAGSSADGRGGGGAGLGVLDLVGGVRGRAALPEQLGQARRQDPAELARLGPGAVEHRDLEVLGRDHPVVAALVGVWPSAATASRRASSSEAPSTYRSLKYAATTSAAPPITAKPCSSATWPS